jgi:ferric-dicitrate binding protein FerR (iron transport regulator)
MTETDGIGALLRLAGPREPVPEDREARVRAAVHAAWRAQLRTRTRRRRTLGVILLAAAAAAVVFAIRSPRPTLNPAPFLDTIARVEVVSSAGPLAVGEGLRAGDDIQTTNERLALRLSSGPGLRIDRGSRLRLVSTSSIELREGAVYVVSGSVGRGLDVTTDLGTVRHIGTRFEVRRLAYTLRLRVREGEALIAEANGAHQARGGEELTVRIGHALERRPIAVVGPEWDWTAQVAPPFPVEGRPLSAYLEWFSAETGRRIRFNDPAFARQVKAIVLHGSVDGLSPDETLDAILPAAGVRYRPVGDAVEVARETGR